MNRQTTRIRYTSLRKRDYPAKQLVMWHTHSQTETFRIDRVSKRIFAGDRSTSDCGSRPFSCIGRVPFATSTSSSNAFAPSSILHSVCLLQIARIRSSTRSSNVPAFQSMLYQCKRLEKLTFLSHNHLNTQIEPLDFLIPVDTNCKPSSLSFCFQPSSDRTHVDKHCKVLRV